MLLLASVPTIASPCRVQAGAPDSAVQAFKRFICIVEGVALDPSPFSPAFLTEHHGDTIVEIRQQMREAEPDWRCTSQAKSGMLRNYLRYQAQFSTRGETMDFCTNVDLGGAAWAPQSAALAALPAWLRPNEPSADLLAQFQATRR